MAIFRIGADELILWLRKNEIGKDIPNDEINGLGQKIFKIIVNELDGQKIEDNYESYWSNSSKDKNIGKHNLPKSSAQYSLDIDKLPKLYQKLSKL